MDEGKTIKELKENINILDETNNKLNNELKLLNTDYELKSFLKKNLKSFELNKIRNLIIKYIDNKSKLEKKLIFKAKNFLPIIEEKKLLLEEKRKLYSGLIPYINTNFKDEYLEYIKGDAKIFNEQNTITTDIIGKKEILNNKVEKIEEKIKKHKIFINESIKKITEEKLEEKIKKLEVNETFNILNLESKIKVLDKTIGKIKDKLKKLELTKEKINPGIIEDTNSSILDKKIQTYYIAVEKLENFKNSLK